ncbi:MAG: sigma 54-interacting transcriptional regulator [Planctomycetota bacterium]|jgi:Nif-specific regulatory protein|nr:sigma 54-interacting transcriptional regulator [Planctomycetota bacterium]
MVDSSPGSEPSARSSDAECALRREAGLTGHRCLHWDDRSQKTQRLRVLEGIAALLAAAEVNDRPLDDVVLILEDDLAVERVTITLIDPAGDQLTLEAARDSKEAQRRVGYRRGEGIIGQVFETGEPVILPNIADVGAFTDRIHRRGSTVRRDYGFICVPIASGARVIGTLSADVLRTKGLSELAGLGGSMSIVAAMIANHVNARRLARVQVTALEDENRRLRESLGERCRPESMIGASHGMREVFARIAQVAASDVTVLLRGESGTGKELAASAIHFGSDRSERPFIRVNCAALNENLLESELFGHELGAFTGAVERRIGRVEEADGGTLFLDEIGEFSHAIQVKLLRMLQEREYQRVGGNETRHADVRIVTATNRDLEAAVSEGMFRSDLYYRVNVFPVHLPPLRSRRDDILQLANHFVAACSERLGRGIRRISTPAIDLLMSYHWPGNVRELENCLEFAVVVADGDVVHSHHLPPTLQTVLPDGGGDGSLKERVERLERDVICDALKRSSGNVAAAARELGITARIARYKIRNLAIDPIHVAREGVE